MNFSWETLLLVAQGCDRDATNESGAALREALYRCAISRAYYAAFGSALRWIRRTSPHHSIPSGGEAHQVVQDFFEWSQDSDYQEIADLLRRMRHFRNLADYEIAFQNAKAESDYAIRRANRVLNALSGLET